jgi:hypothetical protein
VPLRRFLPGAVAVMVAHADALVLIVAGAEPDDVELLRAAKRRGCAAHVPAGIKHDRPRRPGSGDGVGRRVRGFASLRSIPLIHVSSW